MKNRKIRLVVHKPRKGGSETVRLSSEAKAIVNEIKRATSLNYSVIVSQIIIQSADFVEIIEEGDED